MIKKIIYITILAIVISCNSQPVSKVVLNKYLETKNHFENKLVQHFPNKLMTPYNLIHNENHGKNDVSLFLYQYNSSEKDIDSLTKLTKKAIGKYSSIDKCLLIINRFQTIDNRDFDNKIKITDSTKINQECFEGLFPIPSFIDYDYPNDKSEMKLTDDFEIFVLEAKAGIFFRRFSLEPNPQMPTEWKNGYSRGIAISKTKKAVIYWTVIW